MSAFPLYVSSHGKEVIVHAACFGVEWGPPYRRQLLLVVSQPGTLRPELVLLDAGDDHRALAWLIQGGNSGAGVPPGDAHRIVEAAHAVEARFMAVSRARAESWHAAAGGQEDG